MKLTAGNWTATILLVVLLAVIGRVVSLGYLYGSNLVLAHTLGTSIRIPNWAYSIVVVVIWTGIGFANAALLGLVQKKRAWFLAPIPLVLLVVYELHGWETKGCPDHHAYSLGSWQIWGWVFLPAFAGIALCRWRQHRRRASEQAHAEATSETAPSAASEASDA